MNSLIMISQSVLNFTMPSIPLFLLPLTLLVLGGLCSNDTSSYVSSMSLEAQGLFNESMTWMDNYYDASAGYLYDLSSSTALYHETRSSAWYAIGLLARNQGNDTTEALKIITNVIEGQYTDPEAQW